MRVRGLYGGVNHLVLPPGMHLFILPQLKPEPQAAPGQMKVSDLNGQVQHFFRGRKI